MMATNPDLSVCVLAYSSADTISDFVDELRRSLEQLEASWEIVLVGNYFEERGDRTPAVLRALAAEDSRLHVIAEPKQGMMGWDMKSGLAAARGNVIAVIDGDGQMPAADVVRVYEHLLAEDLDLAKTYREQRDDGPWRRFISVVYNSLFRLLFPGLGCRDINSKPKVMTRAAYEAIQLYSDDWFIDAEIMIEARALELRVGEVATTFRELSRRRSFVRPTAILEFMFELLRYRWRGLYRVRRPAFERDSDRA